MEAQPQELTSIVAFAFSDYVACILMWHFMI